MIGSRKASPQGLRRARALARSLVEHKVIVVSGLAAGVDWAAYEAAIACGGQTVAVIGTPLNRCYPREKSGAVLQDWETLRLGRLPFLLESAATDPAFLWPKRLIHYGAQVLSRDNLEVVLENMPSFTAATLTMRFASSFRLSAPNERMSNVASYALQHHRSRD